MRLFLIPFVFIIVEARYSIFDDEKEESGFTCQFKSDGSYSAGQCMNHYFQCHKKYKTTVYCPMGLIFDGYHCAYKEETEACQAYKSDWDIFNSKFISVRDTICERKVDGECNFACSNEYFSCKNGTVTWHRCQAGQVRSRGECMERVWKYECFFGIQFKDKDSHCIADAPKIDSKKVENSKKEFSCINKRYAHYSAGPCSNQFKICLNEKQFTSRCPKGMVFSNDQCHFKRDAKECPEYKTDLDLYRSGNETLKNSICEIRGNGHYEFECENEHYECKDGKTIWKKCPPGEVHDYLKCKKRIHSSYCPEYERSDDESD